MLSKKKAAKRAAISATVRKESTATHSAPKHQKKLASAQGRGGAGGSAAAARADEKSDRSQHHHQVVLTRADAVEAGSGAGSRAELIRSLGDHIDTRLQEITFEDDLDGDVFHERRAQLMEEARLAAGVKQRIVSTSVRDYLGHATELRDVQTVRIAHNCNSITCVAALGTDRIVYGDKSGKVYLVDISLTASGAAAAVGMAVTERAEAQRRRKVLLEPVLPAGVVSVAVSDTSANRPTTRDVFEKTTVDMSCTSYIAAGAMDGSISVWETLTKTHKGLLFMHRKPITGLRFRMDSATLYSCCEDGVLRVWSVPQMMAVDKLYGHEGAIHSIDGLRKETAATVGEDGTTRFWKIDAATQQAYSYAPPARFPESASGSATAPSAAAGQTAPNVVMEAVAMLNEGTLICGARDGSVVVFDVNRRKPLIVVPAAHGHGFIGDGTGLEKAAAMMEAEEERTSARGSSASASASPATARQNPNPITAVAAVPYADVAATASYDGVVRVWHVAGVGAGAMAPGRRTEDPASADAAAEGTKRSAPQLLLVAALPVPAIVNALRFSDSGDVLYIAMAKEPRRGRWVVQSSARNGVLVVPLTEAGRRRLAGMSGEVEHVPAQLFGIDDNAVVEEEEGEGEGLQSSGELQPEDDGDALDDDLDEEALGNSMDGGEGEEEAEDMFSVGPDGMLRFRERGASLPSKATPALGGKTKGKKAKKSGMPKVLRQASAAAGGDTAAPAAPTAAEKKGKKALKKAKKEKAGAAKAGGSGNALVKSAAAVVAKKNKKAKAAKA